MQLKTFKNELENTITITTSDVRASGGAHKEVEICIQGPGSESDWIITLAEAREVLRQLEKAVSAFDALSFSNGSVRAAMVEEAIGA